MSFDTHGRIKCGTVLVPDLNAALGDYRDTLGMKNVDSGLLPAALANSWGTAAAAGRRFALLQPQSGAPCFIRLIESPARSDFKPTTTYGWAAYELTVQDVFSWPARLEGSSFEIVGPPKELPSLPYFVPMQALGPGREMIYLNQVRTDTPSSDLPKAQSPTDFIFIVILAAPDREAAVSWYRDRLGLDIGDTYTLPYSMINNAFGLPSDHMSSLTMIQNGRLPIVEIDDYPEAACARISDAGMLPPGNALVTLAVDDLDALALDWLSPPAAQSGPLYEGRRAAAVRGPAGEWLELIEIAG